MENKNERILHILISGKSGGIESLCKSIYDNTSNHYFCFIKRIGDVYLSMSHDSKRVFSVFDNKKLNLIDCIYATKKIRHFCGLNSISKIVIHHGNLFDWKLARMIKNKKNKVVLYVHSNINDLIGNKNQFFMYAIKKIEFIRAAKKVDKVFAISNSVKQSILSKCPALENIQLCVNYNGIDLKKFKKKENFVECDHIIQIAYVGRLTKEKGIQNTLNLLSLLIPKFAFAFEIIGEGPYLESLKKIVKEKGLDGKVVFSGYSSNVERKLQNKDIFVHLPLWEEGFGIAVLEALATGLICIVNNKGAMSEIITDNVNGFIIDEENNPEEKIEKIFSSFLQGKCCGISNSARNSSLKFSIINTIANIEN